ncbi:hypothetical protein POTOM_002190 [Populus tomentosa]|uniref:Rab3 GTPase-activating protein catalytic subunit n=1 Tax=Populus tomentosa TaxID=118781 RepID=A0A8X8DJA3_POPTO|nr:hypothetical protein POTOM_002190 [Populus tomentosa]
MDSTTFDLLPSRMIHFIPCISLAHDFVEGLSWCCGFYEASGVVSGHACPFHTGSSLITEDTHEERLQAVEASGNSFIWNDAPALPAYEQKPLLDPFQEGEKMVCTAFRASADALHQPNFGGLKLMTTKMEPLYHTIASTLKPLQTNHISGNSETTEDLRRLRVIFENVEKLLTLAVSLHRKFMQAPCLSEAIFTDHQNFYISSKNGNRVNRLA